MRKIEAGLDERGRGARDWLVGAEQDLLWSKVHLAGIVVHCTNIIEKDLNCGQKFI